MDISIETLFLLLLFNILPVLVQITPGVIMREVATGCEDFGQQVEIMVKLKELHKVLRDNIIIKKKNTQ